MKPFRHLIFIFTVCCCLTAWAGDLSQSYRAISGFLKDGRRIIPVQSAQKELTLTVYRGDYIQFQLDPALGPVLLSIPDLSIKQELPADPAAAPHFKMITAGTFVFTLGSAKGTLTVIAYEGEGYRELTSEQAADFIKSTQPLILDVRTPPEYAAGHLPDSVHIPLDQLQNRQTELTAHKDKPILIYCATGNRSTVASKILIDKGFKRISNLRHGIMDWTRKKYPIVK